MRKILFIIVDFEIGGAQNALVRHINLLDQDKYEISIVSLTGKGELHKNIRFKGIKILNLNLRSSAFSLLALFRLYKFIGQCSPDIVHSWMYHADLLGGVIAKIAGVPNIIWGVRSADF